ncbi:MAG: hypothetical protein FJ299_14650 [Planctomycetes bacterium]|nr:hypothetical protein [Planctomycetota bacterium]
MNRFSDQFLASRMLETRARGYSFGLYFRWSAKLYLLLVAYFAFALVALAFLELWLFFFFMLGLFAGCLLRDVGWFRAVRKTWPFSLKVTDWERVQRLADEKDVA